MCKWFVLWVLGFGIAFSTQGQTLTEKFNALSRELPSVCHSGSPEQLQKWVKSYTRWKNDVVQWTLQEYNQKQPNFYTIRTALNQLDTLEKGVFRCDPLKRIFMDEPLNWKSSFPQVATQNLKRQYNQLASGTDLKHKREAWRRYHLAQDLSRLPTPFPSQLDRKDLLEPIHWNGPQLPFLSRIQTKTEQQYLIHWVESPSWSNVGLTVLETTDTLFQTEKKKIQQENLKIGDLGIADTNFSIYDDVQAGFVLHTATIQKKWKIELVFKPCFKCREQKKDTTFIIANEAQWISDFIGDKNALSTEFPHIGFRRIYPSVLKIDQAFYRKAEPWITGMLSHWFSEEGLSER